MRGSRFCSTGLCNRHEERKPSNSSHASERGRQSIWLEVARAAVRLAVPSGMGWGSRSVGDLRVCFSLTGGSCLIRFSYLSLRALAGWAKDFGISVSDDPPGGRICRDAPVLCDSPRVRVVRYRGVARRGEESPARSAGSGRRTSRRRQPACLLRFAADVVTVVQGVVLGVSA